MAVKIIERALCLSCEREFTALGIEHEKVPHSDGSALCEKCHKRRFCARYKIKIGKEEDHAKE